MTDRGSSPGQGFVDPSPLMRLSTAYWDSQTFLTANRIRLFDLVAEEALSATQIADRLQFAARPTLLFLNACVALQLLELNDGKYSNSELSRVYLVSTSPAYLGNAFSYSDNLYSPWSQLEQALRTGTPAMPAERYTGQDLEKTRHFVYGMHNRAIGIGQAMLSMLDLSGRYKLLDVGGGPGTYSALLTSRFPGLEAKVIDLPGVVDIAREIVASMGQSEKVTFIPGDYHETEFPAHNDVVLISGVFHRESAAACRKLIERAVQSMDSGLLVVVDVFTDGGGTSPVFASLFGLNMLLSAPDGGVHADDDVAQWMSASGLVDVTVVAFPPPMPHRMITGLKN